MPIYVQCKYYEATKLNNSISPPPKNVHSDFLIFLTTIQLTYIMHHDLKMNVEVYKVTISTAGDILTFKNPPQSSKIHLVRTIEDHNVFSKAPSHVLGCFSFTSSCRSRRCSPHAHTQRLSQSNVTPANKGLVQHYTQREGFKTCYTKARQ